MPTNLSPESRRNLEAAHRLLSSMLQDAITDLENRPRSQVYQQRVNDLETLLAKLERVLHPSGGQS